jgi:hypothetical protein
LHFEIGFGQKKTSRLDVLGFACDVQPFKEALVVGSRPADIVETHKVEYQSEVSE